MNSVGMPPDTIFSLSSGHGKCGVAVIRVSGASAGNALMKMGNLRQLPTPRVAVLRKVIHPDSAEHIDNGLIIWFPAPNSFTGEDCVEFHVHGGPAILVSMVTALSAIPGVRQAEAGEFTKRAFMNGKLDLTEVEGLGDLIHAETEAQRKQALRQMDGALSQLYTSWRQRIIKVIADVEAHIDFGEDELIEDHILESAASRAEEIQKEIQIHLQDNRQGERLRNGVHVAILGEPNVGKSSLLNSICQRPAAIVSHIPGTTRDIVESAVNIGGFPVLLSDTAGLRDTVDIVEKEGVRRALNRARLSDVKVVVVDVQSFLRHWKTSANNIDSDVKQHLGYIGIIEDPTESSNVNENDVSMETDSGINMTGHTNTAISREKIPSEDLQNVILVLNKSDLLEGRDVNMDLPHSCKGMDVCMVSCKTGQGMEAFVQVLAEKIKILCGGNLLAGNPSLTQARHRLLLNNCVHHLTRFSQYYRFGDEVLAAESLRKTIREMGKLTGKISTEDILDVIFKDFCIGK
ncbi:hypothetical protein FSP39_025054 [Pinctada imbricata]|uniref:TrmE-type G domain-containing protein n=1 Tax=Pinctada imbricata TaxID=66713 RepID=A0AA88YCZ8_PINIB|nr:hypothetical protein FSP39_025054 [Pinctada imbricata]